MYGILLQWNYTHQVSWSDRSLLLQNWSFCGIYLHSQLSITYNIAIPVLLKVSYMFCRCITSKCTWHWSSLVSCMGSYFYLWVNRISLFTYSSCIHMLYASSFTASYILKLASDPSNQKLTISEMDFCCSYTNLSVSGCSLRCYW